MLKKIKQKLKGHIAKKVIKKILNFYTQLETIYPEPLEIKETDKILILAPHADDESIGCGGLLLKYASQCDVVCITNCKTGDSSLKEYKAIKKRKNEFESAMNFLDIKHYFNITIDSDTLDKSYNLFEKLLNQYDLKEYSYIVIPIWYDQHVDHKALVHLLSKYLKENNIVLKCKILFYEVWSTIAVSNRYLDLTELMSQKNELIGFHESQLKFIDYRERVKGLNLYRGMIVNKKYAECYLELEFKEFRELKL